MPFGPAIGAAVGIGGALLSSSATSDATQAQLQAAEEQLALQKQIYGDTVKREAPYLQAGTNSLAALQRAMGLAPGAGPGGTPNAFLTTPGSFARYQQSPGYQFQLTQGIDAAKNAASASGGVWGGNTLKALTQFGQGLANTDYNQWLSNYRAQQSQLYDMLSGVAGSGQNAAANLGGFGQSYANSASNAIGSIGNANAAGSIAQGNILGNLINNPTLQGAFQNMFNVGGFTPSAAPSLNLDPYTAGIAATGTVSL